jgi:hypothetical protein
VTVKLSAFGSNRQLLFRFYLFNNQLQNIGVILWFAILEVGANQLGRFCLGWLGTDCVLNERLVASTSGVHSLLPFLKLSSSSLGKQ